jgi:hypothetical protein
MTLQDFCNMHYTENGWGTVDVFLYEETAQRYAEGDETVFPEFSIQADYQMRFILHNRWYNARVDHFYAIAKDHIAVVVERKEKKHDT